MAFEQKTWKKRISENPTRRKLIDATTQAETIVDVERYEGVVSQEGDAFSRDNMNDLEQRIANAFDDEHLYLTGILEAGGTSITFTSEQIVEGCRVHVFVPFDKCKMIYDAISMPQEGTMVITFPAQATDTVIQVKIENPSQGE